MNKIDAVRKALNDRQGGFVKVWDYSISHSCLRISFNDSSDGIFMHDCERVEFHPAWANMNILIEPYQGTHGERYRVTDGKHLYVDCGQIYFGDSMEFS